MCFKLLTLVVSSSYLIFGSALYSVKLTSPDETRTLWNIDRYIPTDAVWSLLVSQSVINLLSRTIDFV